MTVAQFIALLEEISGDSTAVIEALKTYLPDAQLDAILSEVGWLIPLIEGLAVKGVQAYSNAKNTEITPDSIQALMPDQTPLTPPTE